MPIGLNEAIAGHLLTAHRTLQIFRPIAIANRYPSFQNRLPLSWHFSAAHPLHRPKIVARPSDDDEPSGKNIWFTI